MEEVYKIKIDGSPDYEKQTYPDAITAVAAALKMFNGEQLSVYRKWKYHKRFTTINSKNEWKVRIRHGVLGGNGAPTKLNFYDMIMGRDLAPGEMEELKRRIVGIPQKNKETPEPQCRRSRKEKIKLFKKNNI